MSLIALPSTPQPHLTGGGMRALLRSFALTPSMKSNGILSALKNSIHAVSISPEVFCILEKNSHVDKTTQAEIIYLQFVYQHETFINKSDEKQCSLF